MIETGKISDEKIIEEIQSGNHDLYSIIIDRYQSKLMRYSTNLVHDEEKSADIIQNTFIKAFINLNSFDIKKKFSNWVYRIAHNEAMNIIKKYQKEVPILDDFDFPSEEDITRDFEQKEIIKEIGLCLDKIPLLYSEPLSLYYIDEKSYQEISDILRVPMGTVATRINRAKKLMKNICQEI